MRGGMGHTAANAICGNEFAFQVMPMVGACRRRRTGSIVRRTMARPVDRDLDEVRARLAEWSSGHIARNAPVQIEDLAMPASTGYSGETFLFRARWDDGEQRLVARLKPTGHS